ncbi:MAG: leucine-rich repeat domain-containing protein [Bacilli bacterium]|nr:leucine-rich repeat domain-containing protein [Bacilli bacterium]
MANPHYLLDGELSSTGVEYEESNAEGTGKFDFYALLNNDDEVVGYAVTLSASNAHLHIKIPSSFSGKPVTGIYRQAFYGRSISSISIPTSVTTIDYEAFMNVSSLSEITIPYSVSRLGDGAFYHCTSLMNVHIQNSSHDSAGTNTCTIVRPGGVPTYSTLSIIPTHCFYMNTSLENLFLPSSIAEIRQEAFHGCGALLSPLSFQSIVTVRSYAFEGCNSLQHIYFPSSFFTNSSSLIEPRAFQDCSSLNVHFCCESESSVTAWVGKHTDWGLYTNGNARKNYIYESGNATFSENWIYTTTSQKVTITGYYGPADISFLSVPRYLPSDSSNEVTTINVNALNTVKTTISRLYLPSSLTAIPNDMFKGFTNLNVIAGSADCVTGEDNDPRIDLHSLTNLTNIGNTAFSQMPKRLEIKKLHLPAHLEIVGARAFGDNSTTAGLINIEEFQWDYDESNERLITIGDYAFCMVGSKTGTLFANKTPLPRYSYENGVMKENYKTMTLIIPSTFNNFQDAGYNFAGCPLIETVVFKGNTNKSKAKNDIWIRNNTFGKCDSLRTLICEYKIKDNGTNSYEYQFRHEGNTNTTVGDSAGAGQNDFRPDPGLQTIIMANENTKFKLPRYALSGNSRACIYLSGTKTANITKDTTDGDKWNLIGDEVGSEGTNKGYVFRDGIGGCGISQSIPLYENVDFEATYEVSNGTSPQSVNVSVSGTGGTRKKLVMRGKFAFVCDPSAHTATLSKYLYDRYDENFDGVADIPSTVSIDGDATPFVVTEIGDSAFSAAFTDESYSMPPTLYSELTTVKIPDTVTRIGDYAFMRAYGITTITNKDGTSMPTSLLTIGRHAFAFCGVTEIRKLPMGVRFYENLNAVYDVSSVFTNASKLRRISFLDGGNEVADSTYYDTTTYAEETKTSAIYAKNNVNVPYNKDRLLFVLARDNVDKSAVSDDTTDEGAFTATHNGNPFLFGAYKLGHWITKLILGPATTDDGTTGGQVISQALFSGIVGDGLVSSRKYVYLQTEINSSNATPSSGNASFVNEATNLVEFEIAGSIVGLPTNCFFGCENLSAVTFARENGATIPDGLFAGNSQLTTYNVRDGETIYEPGSNILDLRHTGYTGIGKEAFLNISSIHQFIAPDVANFSIGEGAFKNCSNLTTINLSNVTNTLTLEPGCFYNCGNLTSVTLPKNGATIKLKGASSNTNGVFGNCVELQSIILPATVDELGAYCFYNCKKLDAVGYAGDPSGNQVLTSIGVSAFENCEGLGKGDGIKPAGLEEGFDLRNIANIGQIEDCAFKNCKAPICKDGTLNLPASLVFVGKEAFFQSKLVHITIRSSSITLGENSFRWAEKQQDNSELLDVIFTNPDCTWDAYYKDVFSSNGKLTTLVLPKGYDITYYDENSYKNSIVWQNTSLSRIYTFLTLQSIGTHGEWRQTATSDWALPCFNVKFCSDVLAENSTSTPAYGDDTFWYCENGTVYYLGKLTETYNSGDTVAKFEHGTVDNLGNLLKA